VKRAAGNGQSPCQSTEQLAEQCHQIIIGDPLCLGEQCSLG
jgi:hypothetical protein